MAVSALRHETLMMIRYIIVLLVMLPIMAYSEDVLWGPIDMQKWKVTPCVSGRLAAEQDVKEGRAVFYISGDRNELRPIKISLPACAIWHDSKSNKDTPVVLIQAEETPTVKAIGFRFLSGGNGACTLEELKILQGPDERFK
jgi:hypothetical protein